MTYNGIFSEAAKLGLIPRPLSGKEDEDQSRVVELNVGGLHYATTVNTLKSSAATYQDTGKKSMLYRIADKLEKGHTVKRDRKGRVFIDHDGKLFGYVLDYLRNSLYTPRDRELLKRLMHEAKYYEMEEMLALLKKNHLVRY